MKEDDRSGRIFHQKIGGEGRGGQACRGENLRCALQCCVLYVIYIYARFIIANVVHQSVDLELYCKYAIRVFHTFFSGKRRDRRGRERRGGEGEREAKNGECLPLCFCMLTKGL